MNRYERFGEKTSMDIGKRFLNLPIRFKLIVSYSLVFITALALTNFFVYILVRHIINNSIDNELKRSTSTILNIVKTSADTSIKAYLNGIAVQNRNMAIYFYKQYKKGVMSEEKAKQMATQIILNQPVGQTGYLYCLDSSGVIAVHPEKKLVNTDLSEYGFIQYQKKHKQGYIEYDWKNPGELVSRPKALYMIYFKPWDWIISASSYRSEFAQLVQINDFKDQILALTFGETGYSYIVDSNENIIIHPVLNQTGLNKTARDKKGKYKREPGQKRMDIDQLKMFERIKTICKLKNGKLTYQVKTDTKERVRDKLVVFNHIKEFDWIVVSSGFMDELYAPLKTVKTVFPVTIFIVLIFVLPLSYSISNSITNPLNTLMDRFSRAAKGDTSVRIKPISNDEVGMLAKYFNLFMAQLEKYSKSLVDEIAEQRKTEKEMARIRLYLSAIVDSMPSVLIGVDTKGIVTMWNKEAEKTSRIPVFEAKGNKLTTIFPELDIAMGMADAANCNKQIQMKEKIVHPLKGEGVWADIVVYPLTREVGHGSVIRIDDVSARVKIKDLMVQTEKMKIIAGLSAGMAHEINNPIGCIVQSAQNILRRVSPDLEANIKTAQNLGTDLTTIHAYLEKRQIIKFLEDIRTSVDRTARTVSNMLSFSRKKNLVKIAVDLSHLIDSSVGLATYDYELKKKYDFKSIKIILNFEPGVKKAICIPSEIEQVILNLLKNAAQAVWENKKGHAQPMIKISVAQGEKSVKLIIEDNGPGMDKDVKKRIFEPFFTTKSIGSGTGLGLSVAYYIVTRNHNGTFTVTSEPGLGATFMITLPCEE
ncbi:MAG: cache domain-containing protein [Desulfobacula sp.]|nr:cache domain-containing protein [Desulfobacula sp.]